LAGHLQEQIQLRISGTLKVGSDRDGVKASLSAQKESKWKPGTRVEALGRLGLILVVVYDGGIEALRARTWWSSLHPVNLQSRVGMGCAKNCTLRPQETIDGSAMLFLIDDRPIKPQDVLKIVTISHSFLGDCITPESS
jgi:hypothetical protein